MPSGGIDAARKFRGCCKSLPTLTPLSRLNVGIVTMGEKSLYPLWVKSGHQVNGSAESEITQMPFAKMGGGSMGWLGPNDPAYASCAWTSTSVSSGPRTPSRP